MGNGGEVGARDREGEEHGSRCCFSWSCVEEPLIACLRHEEVKDSERRCSDQGKEQKARVVTEVMYDGAGDHLTERSADADSSTDRPKGEIEPSRALR